MSEWKEVEFGKIPTLWGYTAINNTDLQIGDGNYSSKYPKQNELLSSGIPFISSNDLTNGRITSNNLRYISKEQHGKLLKGHIKSNDVIIVVRGNGVGQVALVSEDFEDANINAQLAYLGRSKNIDGKFLYYLMMHYFVSGVTETKVTGSAQPQITIGTLKTLNLIIPPLPEQERIAEVLSSLDDKIDLLHRNNKTLEQLAETLFRQWFVEEAEDSWKTSILSELVYVKYGKDHKKLNDGDIPAYGSGGVMRMVDKALYDKESVLIPRKGTLSNIIYINKPFWTVDTMFFTEMKKSNIAKYIYHFIKEQDLASMNVGSAVPSMTTDILNNLPITIPPDSVLEIFEKQVELFYNKIDSNLNQIQQLETLRDTLLPKLMSGIVRVK